MSKKSLISQASTALSLYQIDNNESGNSEALPPESSAQIDIVVSHSMPLPVEILDSQVSVKIPAEFFDVIARDWCEKREIITNKYTLEELLSPNDFHWPVGEKELIDEVADDSARSKQVIEHEQQTGDEVLQYKNIFDVISDDENSAETMQKRSDALLKLREMGQRLQSEFPILSIINNEEEHQKALDIMEILLQDYDNNLLLIDALSCAITRYEQSEQFTQ